MPAYFNLFIKALALFLWIAFGERMLFLAINGELLGPLSMQEWWRIALAGTRFDAAIAADMVLLSYLFSHAVNRLLQGDFLNIFRRSLYLAAALLILIHGADTLYYADVGRHIGYELLDIGDGVQAFTVAIQGYWGFVLLQFALIGLSCLVIRWIYAPIKVRLLFSSRQRPWYRQAELQLVGVVLLSVLVIRGGLQSVPLEPLHAQEIGDTRLASVTLNGAYNALFFSFTRDRLQLPSLPTQDANNTEQLFSSLYSKVSDTQVHDFTPYNIIMILLESWPAAYMQSYGASEDTTPYFDALRKESLTTYAMLAGGHRTTEGMFATLCSAQNPLGQTIAQSALENYGYHCLPHVLRDSGYSTAFFQGTHKNTSGTGAFAQLLGFAASYGKEDITDRQFNENAWGVHDPDLYKFVLQKIQGMPRPFLVGINTNSTHDSVLPASVNNTFPGTDSKSAFLNVMHFSDEALHQFMTELQTQGLLDNTIVVIAADHTAHIHSSNFDNYAIPFLIYAPNIVEKQFIVRAASQRDIVPTVLDILGHAPVNNFTGKSLLRNDQGPYFADYYHAGVLGWIEDDTLIEIPFQQVEAMQCFDYRKDHLLAQPQPCPANSDYISHRALAFTQTLQTALFNGQLTKVATRPIEPTAAAPLTELSTTGN